MSNLGFSGLGSGIDTDSIVRQLMSVERRPLFNMSRKLSGLESVKGIWQSINTKMNALKNALSDINTNSVSLKMKATSSKEELFTATAESTAVNGTYDVTVKRLAVAHIQAYDLGTPVDGSIDITVDGKTMSIATLSTDTLETLRDKINEGVKTKKEADSTFVGVHASIIGGKLVLQSEKTGTQYAVTVGQKDSAGNPAAILTEDTTAETVAQDAQVNINGILITDASNTIKNAISGITLNLHKADELQTAKLTVENDTKAATDAVNKFVNAYNDLIKFIDAQTDVDQKDSTQGTLKGDFIARQIMISLREKLTGQIDSSSSLTHLSELGLSTNREGVLSLDTAKFSEALKKSPTDVQEFFFSTDSSKSGVGDLLKNYVESYTDSGTGIIDSREKVIEAQIKDTKSQIESFENRLELREKSLRNQFLAMEKALSMLNNQCTWLAGQIAGLTESLGDNNK